MKSEQNHSNPWSIENAEKYLKYCCPECIFNTKDFQDFSKHFSENHAIKRNSENPHKMPSKSDR